MSIDKIQEAIDVFISGEEWAKARKVARELEPRLEAYVETKYKESLKVSSRLALVFLLMYTNTNDDTSQHF